MAFPREKPVPREEKIKFLMKTLECTEEEAIDVYECDEAIERGERVYFDMTEKEERMAIKLASIGEQIKDTKNTKKGKAQAPNELKEKIIWLLEKLMTECKDFSFENVKITNKSRQLSFNSGEKTFELTLVQKRK